MALFELDIALRQGTFTLDLRARAECRALALFGPSGSGKTSALEAIAGLRPLQRGRIVLDGRVLVDSDANINLPPRLRRVGYVPQDVLLFPHLNVRENIRYGSRAVERGGARIDPDAAIALLELGPLMSRRVASLSGGERQRVALARALHSGPDVLLLDEPLAAIDVPRRRLIVDRLLKIRDELAIPIVYVTHAPEEALAVADVTLVLDAGALVASGPSRTLLVPQGAA